MHLIVILLPPLLADRLAVLWSFYLSPLLQKRVLFPLINRSSNPQLCTVPLLTPQLISNDF